MAEFDAKTVDALNTLLEDERASVEMEVALASGASEYAERETLVAMGADDIGFCVALHEQLDRAGAPVTRRINGVVFQALGAERYDDRLLVFARHQLLVNERYRDLTTRDLDDETHDLLQAITATHDRQIDWLERRAQAFAATRQFDFRGGNVGAPGGGSGVGGLVADVEQAPPRDEPPALTIDDGDPEGRYNTAPDKSRGDLRSAFRGTAPGRRETPAPSTPGAPLRGDADGRNDARYTAPPGDNYADDEYAPLPDASEAPNAAYPPSPDEGFDVPPAPATPPTVRRRYGAYRPGPPNAADNTTPFAAESAASDDAQHHLPNTPYTYAESAYPYGAPDAPNPPHAPDRSRYTAYGSDPNERDGDD